MKLKLDDAGHVVVADGKPVYVFDDGKEAPFDVPDMYGKLARDGKEAPFDVPDMYGKLARDGKTLGEMRRRIEEYDGKLKAYEGIEDPDAARKALELAQNVKDGELVKAGKVEEIKAAANKAAEDRVAAANKKFAEDLALTQKERDQLRSELYDEKIGGAFSRSKFIADKVAIPGDLLRAQFGKQFKVEDGKTVAYDQAGNPIYSRAKPGSLADFDEALESLVDQYPYRDSILKGSGSSGSGARQTNGGGAGPKTVPRSEYEKMPVTQKQAIARDAAAGKVQIVDAHH